MREGVPRQYYCCLITPAFGRGILPVMFKAILTVGIVHEDAVHFVELAVEQSIVACCADFVCGDVDPDCIENRGIARNSVHVVFVS